MHDLVVGGSSEASEYNFYQLLRVLETDAVASGNTASCAIGFDEPLAEEFVEFEPIRDLSFMASSVSQIEHIGKPGFERSKLHVACFGLLGSSGVLPAFYSDMLSNRVKLKDTALKDLISGFNSRSISFLYRAWQKSRIPITVERRQCFDRLNENDIADNSLSSYVGLKNRTVSQNEHSEINSLALYFSGYYSKHPRSSYALKQIVSTVLGVNVNVIQFFGRWFQLASDQQNSLGFENVRTGTDFVIGNAVFEGNSSFRIRTEPVDFQDFERMLPGKKLFLILQEAIRLFVGKQYVVDLQIVLKGEQVPPLGLSLPEESANSARLGIGLWLASGTPQNDADEAVFALNG